MSVTVRKVRKSDKSAWLHLRRKLWPGPREMHRTEIKNLLGKRGFVCFLAWNRKKAIGFSEAFIRQFANGCHEQPVPFLEGLWVDPRFRRRNVGRQLVEAVEKWALNKGFNELGSDAYISAHISHKAHAAYGFKETERVVYFRKPLDMKTKNS